MSSPTILRQIHKRLEGRDLPPEERERLFDLLNLLISGLDDVDLREKSLLENLVEAAADHGNLLRLIERQAAELDALKRISLNLTSSLELQKVLDVVVEEAMRLVRNSHDAQIFLYQDGKLTFGSALNEYGQRNVLFSEPRPDGLTATVARRKQIIVVEDIRKHPLYTNTSEEWKGSIIGIPLMMGDVVVGVMDLMRSKAGEFSPSEIRLLTLLADQAAIAIINARLHAAVSHQARSDALTDLPNRRALDERLDEEIARARRSGYPFAVVMLDLDGFKYVNDTYGHEVGDHALQQVASSLAGSLRSSDFLARYGGDEMTLVLPDTDLPKAVHVARKLQGQLQSMPVPLPDGKTIKLDFTGGIALYPAHAVTAPGLLRAADEALYHAKKHSRGSFVPARGQTGELRDSG